jgi:hypothetical protein
LVSNNSSLNSQDVVKAALKISPNIVLYLPRNSNLDEIVELIPESVSNRPVLQYLCQNGHCAAVVVYIGPDFVVRRNPDTIPVEEDEYEKSIAINSENKSIKEPDADGSTIKDTGLNLKLDAPTSKFSKSIESSSRKELEFSDKGSSGDDSNGYSSSGEENSSSS